MGRTKGGINKRNYKYLMSVNDGDYQYFSSYAEIWNKYEDLNKSAITNIIFHPERVLNNNKYKIVKLTTPVPVFIKQTVQDANKNWIVVLNRIDYTIKLHQLQTSDKVWDYRLTDPPTRAHAALNDRT